MGRPGSGAARAIALVGAAGAGKTTLMEAMLFATPEGNLVADDPHQQQLDLKIAAGASDTPVTQLKTANA